MILLGILLGYFVSGLLLARRLYRGMRPLTVPASCDSPARLADYHTHDRWCYRQAGMGKAFMVDSQGEAVGYALAGSLLWPLVAVGMMLKFAVVAGNDTPRPDELQARIRELESELGIK